MSTIETYIRKVVRQPVLSNEEERALAARYTATKDPAAAARLIESHLQLVVGIASRYCKHSWLLSDLIQEGNIGLLKALNTFDGGRGTYFFRHATSWIRGAVLKYMLDNALPMSLAASPRERRLYCKIVRAQRQGGEMAAAYIAELLDTSNGRSEDLRALLDSDTSIHHHAAEPDSGLEAETPADEAVAAHQVSVRLHALVQLFEERLTPRDREIFRARWLTDKPARKRELGLQHRLHESSIARIEARTLRLLRRFLRSHEVGTELAS